MRFKNKVVVVTGAAGKIAQEMIREIIQEGGFVVTVDIDSTSLDLFLEKLRKENKINFKKVILDISDIIKIEKFVEEVFQEKGRIDILINHAGVVQAESLATTTPQLWEKDININLNGTYYITNVCLKYMKKNQKGSIVTIGSVNSDRAIANPAYSSAKAALVAYTKAIATEYGQFNIRANVVSPGTVKTKAWNHRVKKDSNIFDKLLKWYPLKRFVTPQAVAKATLFLASDEADCISGVNLRVDSGLSAGSALMAQEITSEDFGV